MPSSPRLAPVLAAGVLAIGIASSTPCQACSCAGPASLADSAARADVVFVGTLVDTRDSPIGVPGLSSSGGMVARVFEVSEVRKGVVKDRTEIVTAASGASCGLEVEAGRAYVVVARTSGEGVRADLCGGTRPLTTTTAADLDSIGEASAPTPGTLAVALPVVDPALTDVVAEPIVWGPAAAVVTAVVAAVVLLLRRRRA